MPQFTFVAGRQTGAAALVLLALASTLQAQPKPPVRLSVSTTGDQANGESLFLAASSDQRHVLFTSLASNLVPGDTNGVFDLFIRDRDVDRDGMLDEPGAVATVRVNVGTNGEQSPGQGYGAVLSRDGRFVLFTTAAPLVANDTNGNPDVYMRDRDADGNGVFDEPGGVRTTRVSEGTGNVQGDGTSDAFAMSPDGRFVLFESDSSTFSPLPVNGIRQIYRKDRLSTVLTLVTSRPDGTPADAIGDVATMSDDGRIIAFQSRAQNLSRPTAVDLVYVRDLAANTLVTLPPPPAVAPPAVESSRAVEPLTAGTYSARPGVTPDGSAVYFTVVTIRILPPLRWETNSLDEYDVGTGSVRFVAPGLGLDVTPDSRTVLIQGDRDTCGLTFRLSSFDRATRTETLLVDQAYSSASVSGSVRRVLFLGATPADCPLTGPPPPRTDTNYLRDRDYPTPVAIPLVLQGTLSESGSALFVYADDSAFPSAADTNGVRDVFAVDLDSRLDADADGLDDRWEATFGLSYTSAAGVDGPDGDPDGDGLTNAQEFRAGSHPRGTSASFLAEGAENAFFHTRLAILNPGTAPARVAIRLLADGGGGRSVYQHVPPRARRTIDVGDVEGLPADAFSAVVESDAPLVVDRTMRWGAGGYGAHAERAVSSPSTTWFLAEGSTTWSFAVFYLLENPNAAASTVTIRYLRPAGAAPIVRTYVLPASSRTTIPVNTQAPELAATDVSAAITSDQPILVERAMYLSRDGQPFTAGTDSAGVTAAATSWFLAEGATGPFFDMFILIANPGSSDADVDVRYLLSSGEVLTKTYRVRAESRLTIWVDDEEIAGRGKVLANVDVSATVTSTNGVPVVVERTMWFPGPELTSAFWTEANNSPGSTFTATRWGLADGDEGGADSARTYVLVANTSAFEAHFNVLVIAEDGGQFEADYTVPANSRTTIPIGTAFPIVVGRPFSTIVESRGPGPLAELVVERAMYWDAGGVVWAAGSGLLGTPIP